jgi:hypothetical protein
MIGRVAFGCRQFPGSGFCRLASTRRSVGRRRIMKYLMALVAVMAIFALSAMGVAGVSMPNANNLAGYGKGGGTNYGIEGTISAVADSKFEMTSEKLKKTFIVSCDYNTHFMNGKEKADPSIVKVGAHVGVQGGQNNDQILAQTVTLMTGKK